jgi:four helix bundle protein
MRDYKKIKAWTLADDLAVDIYKISRCFPREELYAMTSQIRRAAYSVPANIAEGAGRRTIKDYLHFLDIAKGSLNETEYFIHLSKRLGYIKQDQKNLIDKTIIEAARCLTGLIKFIENEHGL